MVALLVGVISLLIATPAAAVGVNDAARALSSNPLFIAPGTPVTLSTDDQQQIRAQLNSGSPDVFLAILPRAANGVQLTSQLTAVARTLGRDGIYGATDGRSLVATARGVALSSGQASVVARDVASRSSGANAAALTDFITSAREANASGAAGNTTNDGTTSVPAQRSSSPSALPLLVPLLLLGGVFLLFRSRRRKAAQRQRNASFAEIREASEEDVTRLGEDIADLDLDVSDPRLPAATVEDYRGALDCYDRAKSALAGARSPEQLGAVSTALEEGRWRMSSVRARLSGETPPDRLPPCFFNPQHGPSVQQIEWQPPGGAARQVPVCAADADRVSRGEDPESREVMVSGQRMPYWQAGPQWGGYAGGYYGGFGGMGTGLLTGLMVGNMLGGGFGGHGGDTYIENNYGDSGGGDFGGGDFGGGGFGGGDFGGGDFGGGDFGGGD